MKIKKVNDYITNMLLEQNTKDLQAVKDYCEEQGWVEDYDNIFLPLYDKYGWEFIRDIGEIEWNGFSGNYSVVYLNLDRLSTLVEWNEKKKKWVAI